MPVRVVEPCYECFLDAQILLARSAMGALNTQILLAKSAIDAVRAQSFAGQEYHQCAKHSD